MKALYRKTRVFRLIVNKATRVETNKNFLMKLETNEVYQIQRFRFLVLMELLEKIMKTFKK